MRSILIGMDAALTLEKCVIFHHLTPEKCGFSPLLTLEKRAII
jgi:hypothetical protein